MNDKDISKGKDGQMNKKLKEKLESLDLKSALLTVAFFLIGIFLFYYFTDIRERFRQEDKEEFSGQTSGEIISIEPIERMKQTKWKGTEIFIDSYKVMYSYDANGQKLLKVDFIPLTNKNEKFIKQILDRTTTDVFIVRFDKKDPDKSILVEND